MIEGRVHLTFNADGWPARKIAMFSLLMGMPPMDQQAWVQSPWEWLNDLQIALRQRYLPTTSWRIAAFQAYHKALCDRFGHTADTAADHEMGVCSRCVTFTKDPDRMLKK